MPAASRARSIDAWLATPVAKCAGGATLEVMDCVRDELDIELDEERWCRAPVGIRGEATGCSGSNED